MAGVRNFLQSTLVLGDTALYLVYAILRNWVAIILLLGTRLQQLSKSLIACSFCIWLARNNNKLDSFSCQPSSLSSLKQNIKPASNAKLSCPVGFINQGNTCYGNAILQVLSVVPKLWNKAPSESNALLPMLWTISLHIIVKTNSTKPVDPSNFLWALKRKLSIIRE